MKIASIETFRRGDQLAVVRVRTDDGHEGWGQTSTHHAETTTGVLHSLVAGYFLGSDPWDWEAGVDAFTRATHKYHGTFLWRALCGVDTAVYDLLGKATGRPVHQLIGGRVRSEVPVYGSSLRRDITPADEVERLGRLREQHGFRAFKVKIAEMMGRDTDTWPGRSEDLVRTLRRELGDEVVLHADANGGYSAHAAIRMGRLLEEQGYGHFEEPCAWHETEATAEVARVLDIPVAGGEQDNVLEQFHRMITTRTVDIVQPNIGYIGGIARARKVAQMAEAAGLVTTPHCANQSLLQVFTWHLAVSQPSVSAFQEWCIEPASASFAEGVYGPLPEVVDGVVRLVAGPGWGVEIVPEFLKTAEHRETR
jgi:L-alanine-DL-glutamate epimerase-like enolase superfamily enzyme